MVGDVDESGLGSVVVAAEEVVAGAQRHVRGRDRDVAVPAEVSAASGALAIAHPVVRAAGDRERRECPPRVVGHVVDVRREEDLVPVVDSDRNVGPP
jgi:hypothetical protein